METPILTKPRTWAPEMMDAIKHYLSTNGYTGEHVEYTPERYTEYLRTMIVGRLEEPADALGTIFSANCDQMIHRRNVRVYSTCAHHLLPFVGVAHFAYLPEGKIVGISKIPRLIRVFSRRLQVQEDLTEQIVDAFQNIVKPHGCGLSIRAYHFCEILRGVEEPSALTETTALRGSFKENPQTRDEFLRSIDRSEMIFG
jgi:GTP cyclohydrolase I